jgi:hypothetical protein
VRPLTSAAQAHNTRPVRFATASGFWEELVLPQYAVVEGR